VFKLTDAGMELVEIAPGVDLQKDILAHMDFKPIINQPIKLMDARIFQIQPMGIADGFFKLPLAQRFTHDPADNVFFVNFEGHAIKTRQDIRDVKDAVDKILIPLGHKVDAIVNYDNFEIESDLLGEYTDTVKNIVETYYTSVTRYTASTFLRLKLGEALNERNVASRMYESLEEARQALKK
jgi:propionate CoA-transferase